MVSLSERANNLWGVEGSSPESTLTHASRIGQTHFIIYVGRRAQVRATIANAAGPRHMLRLLHLVIVATYCVLPAAVAGSILLTRRRKRDTASTPGAPGKPDSLNGPDAGSRLSSLAITFIAALAIAVALCLIYARASNGHVPLTQMLLATYFAAALLLLLRGFDAAIIWLLRYALWLHRPGDPSVGRGARVFALYITRTVILLAVGLPYVMAVVMTYRPKVTPGDDPRSQLGFKFERVEFTASDGTRLSGWWIPADPQPARRRRGMPAPATRADAGQNTVIICHGLASSKSNQLILGRRLVPGGFNVLAFDFRAHGESGGQLTSFGALEKRDVLAAVRWVRETHPDKSQKIFGVGASMGGAAVIAAAADPSPEGQAIEAIATYAAYDDLDLLVHDVSREFFERPLGWMLEHVGVPIASAHAGVDLTAFAPAREVSNLWPRPILYIHGREDDIIPFRRGQNLFDFTPQPKYHLWYPQGTHNDIVSDEAAAEIVAEFFRRAKSVPVI
jgi:fermentation-respiration switch protein FrsA (DUF1100 family)